MLEILLVRMFALGNAMYESYHIEHVRTPEQQYMHEVWLCKLNFGRFLHFFLPYKEPKLA
jgi:hypothetical protein